MPHLWKINCYTGLMHIIPLGNLSYLLEDGDKIDDGFTKRLKVLSNKVHHIGGTVQLVFNHTWSYKKYATQFEKACIEIKQEKWDMYLNWFSQMQMVKTIHLLIHPACRSCMEI